MTTPHSRLRLFRADQLAAANALEALIACLDDLDQQVRLAQIAMNLRLYAEVPLTAKRHAYAPSAN